MARWPDVLSVFLGGGKCDTPDLLELNRKRLVGGIPTPLKNMKVNLDEDIPNIWEYQKKSKPPTRRDLAIICLVFDKM